MIDLEFDTVQQTEACLAAGRVVEGASGGTIIANPKARIVAIADTQAY